MQYVIECSQVDQQCSSQYFSVSKSFKYEADNIKLSIVTCIKKSHFYVKIKYERNFVNLNFSTKNQAQICVFGDAGSNVTNSQFSFFSEKLLTFSAGFQSQIGRLCSTPNEGN